MKVEILTEHFCWERLVIIKVVSHKISTFITAIFKGYLIRKGLTCKKSIYKDETFIQTKGRRDPDRW